METYERGGGHSDCLKMSAWNKLDLSNFFPGTRDITYTKQRYNEKCCRQVSRWKCISGGTEGGAGHRGVAECRAGQHPGGNRP